MMSRYTLVFVRLCLSAVLGFGVCFVAPLASADPWWQFRGPDRTGVATADGVLDAWADGQPIERWRRSIGVGFSSVVTDGERLFTMEARGEQEALLAVDPASGVTLWSRPLGDPPVDSEFGDGPRTTPTVVGGRVFTVTSAATLVAVDAASGDVSWRRQLGQPAPRFGYSSSPLVVGGATADDPGLVVVEAGSEDAGQSILGLDAATGEVRWSALDGPANYSSPVLATFAGVPQILLSRRTPEIVALSLDGEVLWRHPTGARAAIALPLVLPTDRVFVASSDDDFGGLMLHVEVLADGTWAATEVWANRLMRNHFNTSVEVEGHLYGFDNATFKCLDAATGERRWAKRGFGKGALIAIGDRLVVLADDGVLALVAADPVAYRELGRVRATTGKAWTEPSLIDRMLVVRDLDELVAFDLGARSTTGRRASVGEATVSLPTVGDATGNDSSLPSLSQVLERHARARGGADRWAVVERLEARGIYAAFSESVPFVLTRARDADGFLDRYRLDFRLMGGPSVRARDAAGAWHQHTLIQPEPSRLDAGPYQDLVERESLFGPVLLRALGSEPPTGFTVSLRGRGDVGGRPTIELEVSFPDDDVEIWSLDAETYLEVRIQGEVNDFTQSMAPMRSYWFLSDFRTIDGLVLPFRIEWEYGARLETMEIESWLVDPPVAADRFSFPAAEPTRDREHAEEAGDSD
ncbi:MAG: PQQ-binding-like beta-propeller repeat protein [Acidobacteriota bacterium]